MTSNIRGYEILSPRGSRIDLLDRFNIHVIVKTSSYCSRTHASQNSKRRKIGQVPEAKVDPSKMPNQQETGTSTTWSRRGIHSSERTTFQILAQVQNYSPSQVSHKRQNPQYSCNITRTQATLQKIVICSKEIQRMSSRRVIS